MGNSTWYYFVKYADSGKERGSSACKTNGKRAIDILLSQGFVEVTQQEYARILRQLKRDDDNAVNLQ